MTIRLLPLSAILMASAVALCGVSAYAAAANGDEVHPVAETKKAAKAVGHGTKKATKAVGHGVRDGARAVGHGTRNVTRSVGHAFRDGAREITGKK